jgi:alkanesulfonate monooxygenase SsuD/methylene tetrahydromethanopterin reductase-like flavin-dependent oxidoreductase (luciferase family)
MDDDRILRISLGLTTSMPIEESRKYAEIADKIGFYRVLVGEDILSREVFTYLTIVALKTKRVRLATGITSPYVRNIAVIASNSIGLQHITGNRFDLGIGPGGISEVERFTGQKPIHAVAVLKETTFLLRKIFNGETVRYRGVKAKLEGFRLNVKGAVPPKIYFGVRGEKLLSLAGRISDGVILSGPKDYLLRAKKIVNQAAAKAGRAEDDVNKLIWNCFINVKSEKDVELAKLVAATIASSLPEKEVEKQDSADEILRIKNDFKKGNYEEASRRVTDDMLANFCFAGSLDEIMEEAEKLGKAGFNEFVVGPPFGSKPAETIKAVERFVWVP